MKDDVSANASHALGDVNQTQATRAPTILVPLDGSIHAAVALPVAATLAGIVGATLNIVHLAEPVLSPRELLDKLGLTPEQIRGAVVDQLPGAPVEGIIRLVRERQTSMIVMCPYTRTSEPGGKLGSVLLALLPEAPCPIVLVPPARGMRPWALRRMLLPHDGAPSTAGAFGPAIELAQQSAAECDILYVAAPTAPRSVDPGSFTVPCYVDQPQHEWPHWSHEFLERTRQLCDWPTTLPARLFLRPGDPVAEILRFAGEQHSDLIVLAWHGHLEAQRASMMKEVIRHTPCPVLVVRIAP